MEDDVLHFSEGVLVDDVIGAGPVGIIVHREDPKPVIKLAPSNIFQHFINVERRIYERLNQCWEESVGHSRGGPRLLLPVDVVTTTSSSFLIGQ
jgi:hypothetical protein